MYAEEVHELKSRSTTLSDLNRYFHRTKNLQ